jgi:hypothetical protein
MKVRQAQREGGQVGGRGTGRKERILQLLVLERVWMKSIQIPVTPLGTDPITLRFVVQCLNQPRHHAPPLFIHRVP